MLNEVVKGLKRTKTDWLSPNLSEPVRAVRTAEENGEHSHSFLLSGYSGWGTYKHEHGYPTYVFKLSKEAVINGNSDYWDKQTLPDNVTKSGKGQPHNNIAPAIAVYAWVRIA